MKLILYLAAGLLAAYLLFGILYTWALTFGMDEKTTLKAFITTTLTWPRFFIGA